MKLSIRTKIIEVTSTFRTNNDVPLCFEGKGKGIEISIHFMNVLILQRNIVINTIHF
jgi:hypothetical protein